MCVCMCIYIYIDIDSAKGVLVGILWGWVGRHRYTDNDYPKPFLRHLPFYTADTIQTKSRHVNIEAHGW